MMWGHSGGVLFESFRSLGETCDFEQTTIFKFEVFAIFAVSSPSAFLDLILGLFLLHFCAQKSSETLLRGGSEK